jgi:hypothetical protein
MPTFEVLDVLKRTGQSPVEAIAIAETFIHEQRRIEAQRYRSDRESSELAEATVAAATKMAKVQTDLIAAAKRERDNDLSALEQDLRNATAVPLRQITETSDDFARKLTGFQTVAVDQVRRTLLAVLDAQAIRDTTDPDELAAIALAYVTSSANSPDLVIRIGRLVEQRLRTIVRPAVRRGESSGPAFTALTNVETALRQWRTAHATTTPEARRASIEERFRGRVADIHRGVAAAAGPDVTRQMEIAAARAAFGSGDAPKPSMVEAPVLQRQRTTG